MAGAAEQDREKSLAGSRATASAAQAGVIPLLGGDVEVRFLSLPLHCPGENPCLVKTGRQRRDVCRHLLKGVVLGMVGRGVVRWLSGWLPRQRKSSWAWRA